MTADHVLEDLQSATGELAKVDNELCSALSSIESSIRLRVSTRIELVVSEPLFDRIAFGKLDNLWCLQIERGGEWCPLVKAPRETRAAALSRGHIKRLVLQSAAQVRNQITERRIATEAARELLDFLTINVPEIK